MKAIRKLVKAIKHDKRKITYEWIKNNKVLLLPDITVPIVLYSCAKFIAIKHSVFQIVRPGISRCSTKSQNKYSAFGGHIIQQRHVFASKHSE